MDQNALTIEKDGTSMSTGVPRDQTGLMKPAEAAEYLNCSLRTLQEWKNDGNFGYHKHGRWVRYAQADLDAFLAKTYVPARRNLPPKRPMLRIDQQGRNA
jgi:excisionase family DNA binding protein